MNLEQQQAYGWAKSHDYPSVAAQYARALASAVDDLQAELADYHHMSELVDGKMEENQRLRRINENLQEQLADSQRRADAVEMNEDNRVRLLQYDNLRKCFSELCDLILGRKYYNEAMDAYRADEFCCRDIWDKVKPMLSRKQWRGPQEAGKERQ